MPDVIRSVISMFRGQWIDGRGRSWRSGRVSTHWHSGAIRQMGWFIEEWRAGVFAQGLGQAIPVNEESLREQWQEVRRSSGG